MVISAADDRNDGPRIWVGGSAAPVKYRPTMQEYWDRMQPEEGGVFEIDGNLAVLGRDEAGLLAAAEAFASRAPYIWRVPGDKLIERSVRG